MNKFQCIVCGKRTGDRIWVGGFYPNGKYKQDAICSQLCFVKACALFLPSKESRDNAKKKLLEMERI